MENAIEVSPREIAEYRGWLSFVKTWQQNNFDEEFTRYRNYFRSQFPDKVVKDKDLNFNMICNEFWVNTKTQLPNLYFQNPVVAVTPKKDKFEVQLDDGTISELDGEETAEKVAYIDNYYLREYGCKAIFKRSLLDALVTQYGVIRLGWSTRLLKKQSEDGEIASAERILGEKEEAGDAIPGEVPADEYEIEEDKLILERLSPQDILIDPATKYLDLSDCRKIGIRYILPLAEIKADDSLILPAGFSGTKKIGDKDYAEEMVEAWEIWDKPKQRVVILCDGTDQPLKTIRWPHRKMEGFPVELLGMNEDLDSWLPLSEYRPYEAQVVALTKLRIKMIKLLNRLGKTYVVDRHMDQSDLDKITNAEDGELIHLKTKTDAPIGNLIQQALDFNMSGDYISLQQLLRDDIERMSGISDFQRGIAQEGKKTATEIMQISGSMNLRIEEKRDIVSDWIGCIVRKMTQLIQENMDDEDVIRITKEVAGKTTNEWLRFTKNDIQGEFFFDVDASSALKKDDALNKKYAHDTFTILNGDPFTNQKQLRVNLHKADGVKNIEEMMFEPPPPSPAEAEKPKASLSVRVDLAQAINDPRQMEILSKLFGQPGPQPMPGEGMGGGSPAGGSLPAIPPTSGQMSQEALAEAVRV